MNIVYIPHTFIFITTCSTPQKQRQINDLRAKAKDDIIANLCETYLTKRHFLITLFIISAIRSDNRHLW